MVEDGLAKLPVRCLPIEKEMLKNFAKNINMGLTRSIFGLVYDELEFGTGEPVYIIPERFRKKKLSAYMLLRPRQSVVNAMTKIAHTEYQCTLAAMVRTLSSRALIRLAYKLPEKNIRNVLE